MSDANYTRELSSEASADPIVLGDRQYNVFLESGDSVWDGGSEATIYMASDTDGEDTAILDPYASNAALARTAPSGLPIVVQGPGLLTLAITTFAAGDSVRMRVTPPTRN